MAFTFAQQLNICKILQIEMPALEYALTFNAEYITGETETQVLAEVTRWATAGVSFVNIHPKEANKGAEIRANAPKDAIRRNIANLLYMSEWLKRNTMGGSQRITRG
jgi:hypothetical protein